MFATLFRSDSTVRPQIDVVALILRASLAVIFLVHGWDKISGDGGGAYWAARMIEHSSTQQTPAGLTLAGTQLAVAWGEFLGGVALAAGLLTRLAALGLIIIQIGAVFLVTAARGFYFERGGGYEYNLALVAMCLALLILGAGRWSLDGLLARNRMKAARLATTTTPPLAGPHLAAGSPMEQVTPGQPHTM